MSDRKPLTPEQLSAARVDAQFAFDHLDPERFALRREVAATTLRALDEREVLIRALKDLYRATCEQTLPFVGNWALAKLRSIGVEP